VGITVVITGTLLEPLLLLLPPVPLPEELPLTGTTYGVLIDPELLTVNEAEVAEGEV
jgi:hypothetical protein